MSKLRPLYIGYAIYLNANKEQIALFDYLSNARQALKDPIKWLAKYPDEVNKSTAHIRKIVEYKVK